MQDIKQRVLEIATEFVPQEILGDEQNWDCTFKQLGIDSLDVMTVFLNVQEKFGTGDIPEEKLDELKTLNDICRYIQEIKTLS